MNISKVMGVARWEFVEKAKTKAYLVSLVLTPLIMALFAVLPTLLASRADTDTKQFLIYDATGLCAAPLQEKLISQYKLPDGRPNYTLKPVDTHSLSAEEAVKKYKLALLNEEYTGLIVIPADVFTSRRVEYRGANVGNAMEVQKISSEIEKIIIENALVRQGIPLDVYSNASREISVATLKVTKDNDNERSGFMEVFIAAYGSIILLFMIIMVTGQLLVRSLFEEKSNRIIEILLSSCSPLELMIGKLLGLSGLGILQALLWLSLGSGLGTLFGALPNVLALVPFLLMYMLLGYLFYAAILIGVGSLATTEQEAQQITGYIALLVMLPVGILFPLMQNPSSALVKTLSYIPFMTPTVMTMRIAVLRPEWWEIALSVAVMLVSIAGVMYVSAKIFRAAILSYGKRPTLPEIIGFLREK